MKNIFTVLTCAILIWGCAKKMAPAKPVIPPATNTGSVINNNSETPSSYVANTTATNTQPTFTTSADVNGTKSLVTPGTQSPDMLSQIAGQNIFNAKCGRCHPLRATTGYTSDRWASIIAVMANSAHANLNDTEKENVLSYVRANSKQ